MGSGLGVLLAVAAALAVLAVLFALMSTRGKRWSDRAYEEPEMREPFAAALEDRPQAAVVVNPTKFDHGTDKVRRRLEAVCSDLGWAELLWLETTVDDPGIGQTRTALDKGADVVLACGGDGTVRCVGQVLAGTGTPLGLLPAGTGNLLARNLEMDVDDIAAAMRIGLSGDDRPVDVGWVTVVGEHGEVHTAPEEQAFLVMAGMGFDAAVMATAPEDLKARVGPLAYIVAGLRLLRGKQTRVRLELDGGEPLVRRVRTVVIGNCGRLLGGIELMPDAELDDGWLDVVSIAPKGIGGWAAVAARVITKRRRGHSRVEHWRARAVTVTGETPQPCQLDGDPVGDGVQLDMRLDPGALLVRVPARGR